VITDAQSAARVMKRCEALGRTSEEPDLPLSQGLPMPTGTCITRCGPGSHTSLILASILCSNRAATRVNDLKVREKCHVEITSVCRRFANSRKLRQSILPPLHGGGQGFESPRLHSETYRFAGETRGIGRGPEQAPGSLTATDTAARHPRCGLRCSATCAPGEGAAGEDHGRAARRGTRGSV
jgi:hypothetical protein